MPVQHPARPHLRGAPGAAGLTVLIAARRMAMILIAGGLTALFDVQVLRSGAALDPTIRQQVTALALLALVVAAGVWLLPWDRWPRSATLSLAAVASVLHLGFVLIGSMTPVVSVAFTTAILVWMAVFHSYRATLVLMGPAAASHALPLWWLHGVAGHLYSLLGVLLMWVLVCHMIAYMIRGLRRAQAHLDRQARVFEQVAEAGRRLSQVDPTAIAVAALEALRDTGACTAALLLDVQDGDRVGQLVSEVTTTPTALTRGGREALEQRLGAASRPGSVTLRDTVFVDGIRLRTGDLLVFAPLAVPEGRGILVAVYRPDQDPGHAQLQATALLAAQTAQHLSIAALLRSEREKARQSAAAALRDALTGIGNRRVVDEALDDLHAGDVVVMLDLDHFKRVNDEHGHAAGDDILRQLATYLQGFARHQDTAGRYGGEEFTLVLAQAAGEADGAVERLLAGWRAQDPVTTLSAGYAVHAGGSAPADTLHAADSALYHAKRDGRDRAVRAGRDAAATPGDGDLDQMRVSGVPVRCSCA